MLPWEHLAVGYLCFSLLLRLRERRPSEYAALAVVLGTQFPDLIDKPLSWSLNLLPAGVFAHTVFVAVPVSALVIALARSRGRLDIGLGFAVGYLSHLPADLVPGYLLGGELDWWYLFWPAVARPGSAPVDDPILGPGAGAGFLRNTVYYISDDLQDIAGPRLPLLVAGELCLLGAAVWLWSRDGYPGLAVLRGVRRRLGGSKPQQ